MDITRQIVVSQKRDKLKRVRFGFDFSARERLTARIFLTLRLGAQNTGYRPPFLT